jgi:hypothetical protein
VSAVKISQRFAAVTNFRARETEPTSSKSARSTSSDSMVAISMPVGYGMASIVAAKSANPTTLPDAVFQNPQHGFCFVGD